jgi:alpha-N-arabinofuranosidase
MLEFTFRWAAILLSLSGAVVGPAEGSDLGPSGSWAQFRSFSYRGKDLAADLLKDPPRQYLNPIIAGFYPDPSICRVGDDYYLVNSSFCYFPGIPIFHSRDLVGWTQIGFVLNRAEDFSGLREADVSRGVYAPTIRYHNGIFYVITTLVGGDGNFFVTATNPAGPWSEPQWLPSVEGIDPSFFFDDDGRAYVLDCAPAPDNKPLYDGHRTIRMQEFAVKTGRTTGPTRILVNGGTDITKHPVWIEGPHLFKRAGFYYLIAAEGGTGSWHSEVVFRADSAWGPYVPFKENPILTQRRLPNDRTDSVTNVGHADFVQTTAGDWWAVFLACRPYERNFFNTGRETFMLPVSWNNDWPVVLKDDQTLPRIVDRPKLPPQPPVEMPLNGTFQWTDTFDRDRLSTRWNFLRAPSEQWYSLKEIPGSLLIAPRPVELSALDNPSFIACRQQHADFSASTVLAVNSKTASCDAGLAAFQNERHYFFLGVRIRRGNAREIFLERAQDAQTVASAPISEQAQQIELKIEAAGRPYSFSYRVNDGGFKLLADNVDGSFLSTEAAGGFQGVMLGMFARKGE